MIKSSNLESIRWSLSVIFFFLAIIASPLIPCPVSGSDSMKMTDNAADEIATFDEDEEAAFDTEPAVLSYTISYFPDRSFITDIYAFKYLAVSFVS